jgi:hypothetical protein
MRVKALLTRWIDCYNTERAKRKRMEGVETDMRNENTLQVE